MHGAFHLDKGFPLTIKELFTKPGVGVRKYIEGKRTGYFNYLTLILILIGISHFFESYTQISVQDVFQPSVAKDPDPQKAAKLAEVMDRMFNLTREYPKTFIISFIPVYAIISRWIFKKSKLNYAEHLVIVFYKMSAVVIISFIDIITRILTINTDIITGMTTVVSIFTYLYTVIFMYQYFKVYDYSKGRLIWKSIRYTITETIIQSIIIGLGVAGYIFLTSY